MEVVSRLEIWRPSQPARPTALVGPTGERYLSVSFSPDGERLLAQTATGELMIWDAVTGQYLTQIASLNSGAWVRPAWTLDGRFLGAGSDAIGIVAWCGDPRVR